MGLFLFLKTLYTIDMNKTLIEENKAKLLAEKTKLQTILKHNTTVDEEFPGGHKPQYTEAGTEQGENASEVEQFANDLSVTTDLEQRLKKVEAALERVERGTYGICIMGEEIDEARLRAEPAAETCVIHAK